MSSTNGKGVTIVRVDVENFHRLRLAEAGIEKPTGLIRITGNKGQGKSSLLRAVKAALGGAGEVLPRAVNDESEDGSGQVRIELTNGITVTRRFTEKAPKGYLTVEAKDGARYPQAKLNEILGPLSFDPLAFFDLKPDRQREILFSLGTDPDLPKKLEEVKAERKRAYDERTPWISQQRRASQVSRPEGERPEPVDVSAEMERLRVLRLKVDSIQVTRDEIAELDRQASAHEARIDAIEEEIQRLQKEREERKSQWKLAQDAMKKKEADLDGLGDPTEEIAGIEARISEADAVNEALEPWKTYGRARESEKEAKAKVEELTNEIGSLDVRERDLLTKAGIPIPGLTFDTDGSPLLNGRPLEIASGGERIELAVAVALAADPDLRICLVDEANDLDLESLEALNALAEEHGFQIWACRIGLEGPGEIVVEDGEARSAPQEETAGAVS